MSLFEIGHRETYQVSEKPGAELKVKGILQNEEDQRPNCRRCHANKGEQTEAKSEND